MPPLRRHLPAALATAAALILGGCSASGGAGGPGGQGGGGGGAAPAADFPYVREGTLAYQGGAVVDARVAVTGLHRTPELTAVDLEVTALGELPDGGEGSGTGDQNAPILIDPVGGRAFAPLSGPGGTFYGSDAGGGRTLALGWPDVPHTVRLYYPRLPDGAEQVTLAGLGLGAMTGLPVTDTGEVPAQEPNHEEFSADSPPPDGTPVVFPEKAPPADAEGEEYRLESFVDSETASTTRDGDTETIALHSDVMFEFDSADVTGDAAETIAETAGTLRSRRVPEGAAVAVTGHTDGKGSDDYNQRLSEERAEVVAELLEEELGSAYGFEVSGKGASEPVAEEGGEDDEEARARNRRVEVSYELTDDRGSGGAEPAEGEGALASAELHPGEPAAFRTEEPEPAATATTGDGLRLDVAPLLRDGAYLAASVTITNEGDSATTPDLRGEAGGPARYEDDTLGGFQLREPDGGLVRYVAQATDGDRYAGVAESVYELEPGASYRSVAYFPAPAADVDELTLIAGPFGELDGVPVQ